MEKKKKPYIAIWIAITVLSLNQMWQAHLNHQAHQELQQDYLRSLQFQTETLRSVNESMETLRRLCEWQLKGKNKFYSN